MSIPTVERRFPKLYRKNVFKHFEKLLLFCKILVYCNRLSTFHVQTPRNSHSSARYCTKRIMAPVPVNFQALSHEQKREFLSSFDTIVSDCDGVIWNPKGVINDANRAVEKLMRAGKRVYFVTNNSTKTKEQLANKFNKLGFVDITGDSIVSTASLAADYLQKHLPPGKVVYLVGSSAMSEELRRSGIECFGSGPDEVIEDLIDNISTTKIEIRENVGAVLVGFDIFINFMKILKACTYLKNEDCMFLASNTDETFPSATDYVVPGSGSIVAPIRTSTGREPLILGKPSPHLRDMLQNRVDPARTLFIGDRLNTDILMGRRCSFKTLLVLTGVHSLKDVEYCAKSENFDDQMCVPDYYTQSFSDLICE